MNRTTPPIFSEPLDRVALVVMAVLAALTMILLLLGDHSQPLVRDFSWQGKQVGAEDQAFVLTFNRLMNWSKVTENLKIAPNLEGKTSWTGRRLAYTLNDPIPYGKSFQLKLADVPEALPADMGRPKPMRPFQGNFRSRDQAFAYIGVSQTEAGRLVLFNQTQNRKTLLTPPELVVFDFKPYTTGDRILFSASTRNGQNQPVFDPELYEVGTGIAANPPGQEPITAQPVGKVTKLLDNRDYQLFKFDLARDGQTIVVQRALKSTPGRVSLWVMHNHGQPQKLEAEAGGDFLIAPDGSTLVMSQGQGLALFPLTPDQTPAAPTAQKPEAAGQPLDFLPQFGMVLDFANDGSAAAMVKFNSDSSRSLFLVTNQGQQKEVARIQGTIFDAQFDPKRRFLYCLLTRVLPGEDYKEQPYIAVIDLQTSQLTPILELPQERDLQMSLAPDGSGLIFNQVVTLPNQAPNAATPANTSSNLWRLPILSDAATSPPKFLPPEPLMAGSHVRWLP
jgi:hypothetical protein